MGGVDQKRLLSWLSQLDKAGPVIPQGDNPLSARFTFDGIPIEKQTFDANSQKRSPRARPEQTQLELGDIEKPHLLTRPTTRGTHFRATRKERNGYERIPRAKTKEDRYEYKGNSRLSSNQDTAVRKKKPSRQKRKHTINDVFCAPNVSSNRLTLHSATNLGMFNRGKRSSPVKTRVVDQCFSETEFLSKGSVHEQRNRSYRRMENTNMFEYDSEISNFSHAPNKTGIELLRPSIEGTIQQLPRSGNVGLGKNYTAIYRETENDPTTKADAITAPSPQSSSRGPRREGLRESLELCSQGGQDVRSIAGFAGESGPMQLLGFGLHSPDESVTTNPVKKYWTLDDLKFLMKQRTSAWKPEEENMTTLTSRLQQNSRKRKHTSSQESLNFHPKTPKQRRASGQSQRLEFKPTDNSTGSQPPILSGSISGGCIDSPLGKPLSAHALMDHAIERTVLQPQRPFRDKETSLLYEDTSFISQVFDAAYEAIMRPEKDTHFDSLNNIAVSNYNIGNSERSIAPVLEASWERGLQGQQVLDPSYIGRTMLLPYKEDKKLAYNTTEAKGYCQQQSYLGSLIADREPLPIEENWTPKLGQFPGWNGPEANKVNVDVDPMKNFWRQNKLY